MGRTNKEELMDEFRIYDFVDRLIKIKLSRYFKTMRCSKCEDMRNMLVIPNYYEHLSGNKLMCPGCLNLYDDTESVNEI